MDTIWIFYHQAMDQLMEFDEHRDGLSWFKDGDSFWHFSIKRTHGMEGAIDFDAMDLVLLGKLGGGQL